LARFSDAPSNNVFPSWFLDHKQRIPSIPAENVLN
jgi:hypothetical protein